MRVWLLTSFSSSYLLIFAIPSSPLITRPSSEYSTYCSVCPYLSAAGSLFSVYSCRRVRIHDNQRSSDSLGGWRNSHHIRKWQQL